MRRSGNENSDANRRSEDGAKVARNARDKKRVAVTDDGSAPQPKRPKSSVGLTSDQSPAPPRIASLFTKVFFFFFFFFFLFLFPTISIQVEARS